MVRFLLICFLYTLLFFSCSTNQLTSPISTSPLKVQDFSFTGYWAGELDTEHYHLPFGFEIDSSRVKIDNPTQGMDGAKADSTTFTDYELTIYLKQVQFNLTPRSQDIIDVTLKEGSKINHFPIVRNAPLTDPLRPQHPKGNPDYEVSDVTFYNEEDDIELSGTLTSPKGNPGAFAILLTGSGPQDRDETLMHHKPFAVIADHLTRNGIAVLRYDDRGTGKSKGSFNFATSFDFAQDAAAAYDYLSDFDPGLPIGFIGHSEGGMVAQIADSLVSGADFHIYLAGPGIDIIELMVEQNKLVLGVRLNQEALEIYITRLPEIFELIASNEDLSKKQEILNIKAKALYNELPADEAKKIAPSDMVYAMSLSQLMYLKWWPYFMSYQPGKYLSQIKCPILALNGEKDIQVTPHNLSGIEEHAIYSDVTTVTIEQANHLFQKCVTCNIVEYGILKETFSKEALDIMTSWMKDKGIIN